jgi:protein O-GlcNAc transferase
MKIIKNKKAKNLLLIFSVLVLILVFYLIYKHTKESFNSINIENNKLKKIIAFTLWGDNKCYNYGALENALVAKKLYPDFICRFYIGQNVILDVINKLKELDNVEIVYINKHKKIANTLNRFLPMYENDVEILLSRDTDSLINIREKLAVNEWLQSDKKFHIMRNNEQHSTRILGGMYGIKISKIKLNKREFDEFLHKSNGIWGDDQTFLQNKIYPKIKDSVMIHDSNHHYKDEKIIPFPKSNYNDFVGNYSCNNYKEINKKYGLNFESFERVRDTK